MKLARAFVFAAFVVGAGCTSSDAPEAPRWRDRVAVQMGEHDPQFGPADALVDIVVFSDYRCSRCGPAIDRLLELQRAQATDLRVTIGWAGDPDEPESLGPALGGVAAARGGCFEAYHQALDRVRDFTPTGVLAAASAAGCDRARFVENLAADATRTAALASATMASDLGVAGTPAILVNGRVVPGNPDASVMRVIVDRELRHARRITTAHRLSAVAFHESIQRDGRASLNR